MAWPCRTELWGSKLDDAKRDYAVVARAISEFEPVLMVCMPGLESEVAAYCGADVRAVAFPINDSWTRDNGPVFAYDQLGNAVVLGFEFNAWGNRWHPYSDDAKLPERIADLLGLPFHPVDMVLEGGSWYSDGAGTIFTTEQCLA